jgi:hypothetical protein
MPRRRSCKRRGVQARQFDEQDRARGIEADAALIRMGDLVPPMFTFHDPDGNRFRMVERD